MVRGLIDTMDTVDVLGRIDSPVNIVAFVMDYVELHFNGPIFRTLADPVVRSGSRSTRFPEPGSRDALCELINRELVAFTETADSLVLTFEPGPLTVEVPRYGETVGPEIAHFIPALPDGSLDVAAMWIWDNQWMPDCDRPPA